MLFERNRLFKVEFFEITVLHVYLKPIQSLRSRIYRWLAVTLGFLQIGKLASLDPFVIGIVFCHGSMLFI